MIDASGPSLFIWNELAVPEGVEPQLTYYHAHFDMLFPLHADSHCATGTKKF